jgi:hypothetical protein
MTAAEVLACCVAFLLVHFTAYYVWTAMTWPVHMPDHETELPELEAQS